MRLSRRGAIHAGRQHAAAGGYAAEVAADSPTWWLRLSETSGSTVADEIGTNDGTVFGANLNVSPFSGAGSGASFDGTDDYIQVPNNATLNAGNQFSFECLVKINNPSADGLQLIADKTELTKNNNQFAMWWDNRSSQGSPLRLNFNCGFTSGTSENRARWEGTAARDAIAAGIHVVGTCDTSLGISVLLHVNGVEVGASDSGTMTTSANTLDLNIGSVLGGFFAGMVADEFAIYDKVLTPARILAHAQAAGLA